MPRGDRLFELLGSCDDNQLLEIWTRDLRKKETAKEYDKADAGERHLLISAEVRSAAGHTVENLSLGDHEMEWRDVLDHAARALAASIKEGAQRIRKAYGSVDAVEERGLEPVVLALADERVRQYLDRKGTDPAYPGASLPELVAAQVEAEDKALRTVNPSESAFSAVDRALSDDGALMKVLKMTDALVREVHVGHRAMRPASKKVVPAVVRLLQINRIAPLELDHV